MQRMVAVDEKGARREICKIAAARRVRFHASEAAEMSSDEIFNRACQAEASAQPELAFSSTRRLCASIQPTRRRNQPRLVSMPAASAAERPTARTRAAAAPATHGGAAAARWRPHLWRARSSIIRPGVRSTVLRELLRESGYNPTSAHAVWRQPWPPAARPPPANSSASGSKSTRRPPPASKRSTTSSRPRARPLVAAARSARKISNACWSTLCPATGQARCAVPVYPLALAWPPEHRPSAR